MSEIASIWVLTMEAVRLFISGQQLTVIMWNAEMAIIVDLQRVTDRRASNPAWRCIPEGESLCGLCTTHSAITEVDTGRGNTLSDNF